MKVIIAGGRMHTVYQTVVEAVVLSQFKITTVIEGGANGVDRLAREYAQKNNIPFITVEADWRRFGLNAGPVRNKKMAEMADALIALWDGKSRGTGSMIREAKKRRIKVFVLRIDYS